MSKTYLLIIAAIAVAYLIYMYGLRRLMTRKPADVVTDMSAYEAMKLYLGKTLPELNVGDYRLLWGSTFGNTDINRIFAYNSERILVIPAKVLNGELVMPEAQPSADIELDSIDHIWFGKKESSIRMMFVTLFFNAKDDDNNFDIWREKKDVCGDDNRPAFREFIAFMEGWAKEHSIRTEDL